MQIRVKDINLWQANYRVGDVDMIKRSIQKFGYNRSVALWRDHTVIAGNHTIKALQSLEQDQAKIPKNVSVDNGDWVIDVMDATHLSVEEAQAYAIADNRASDSATNDDEQLASLLSQVREYDEDLLKATGWGSKELDELLSSITPSNPQDDPGAQVDRAEELNEAWQVKRGDLWQIGEHRLLCGDSTNEDDVKRLMGGELADCVVTDPPYGQNQAGVTNDSPELLDSIICGVVKNLPIKNGVICAFQSPRTFPTWLDYTRANGYKFERMLWMYKAAQMTFPWRGWILKSESILVSSVGDAVWNEINPYSHDCYYLSEVSNELPPNSGWHGSVKPLAVVKDLQSRVGVKNTYDPFLGSGTTMVASEQLNRRCYGIEIEPKYCAVILERMAGMGLSPALVSQSENSES
jgi:hypothetical protein